MSHQPFVIRIDALRDKAGARQDVDVSGLIEGLAVSGSAVPTDSTVGFKGVIEAMEAAEGVVAAGKVTGTWAGECRRCLGPASGLIDQPVREIFEPKATEGETYELRRGLVDIEPMIREAVVLDLPEAPLCSADCKGLCPNCGTNWNEASCECDNTVTDPRWAGLDVLKDEPGV